MFIRVLSDDTSLAPCDNETLQALQDKHPPPPPNLSLPPPPGVSSELFQVSPEVIEKSVHLFKHSSSAGPDKLSPQHLKELISHQTGEAGSCLLSALTALADKILSGNIPDQVRSVFFGANLIALQKPDGGVRPLLLGLLFVVW